LKPSRGKWAVTVRVEQFSDEYVTAIVELVQGILRDEFGFSGASAEQPDLSDIRNHYGRGDSNFWIALDGSRLVGTIGFVDIGFKQGLLRKMFVHTDCRGTGVAMHLLDHAMKWARDHGFVEIYLGTNAKFHAAQRFYAKRGFSPVPPESLPHSVPRLHLRDRFYCRAL
jgi:N-acetylglutamate synthase-like GNAT family acetyltransferase